jgi:chemotaxis protein MotB
VHTRTSFLLGLSVVAMLAACGVKKSTHQKALDQIKLLEGQLSDANAKGDDQSKRVTVLEADLTKVKADLDKLASGKQLSDEEIARVRGEKEATEAELKALREQRDAQEKRLASYRDLQNRFKQLVATGALEVQFRNGQMTLKLPSGVLFPSGSADLSEEGDATLAQVTDVLMAFKDRRFLVAGHTDNIPIKTKKFKNNWYLSSARAVSVVEFMIDAGFPADKLAAAGYADKDPVGDNASPQGRELNRRIEIILVPDLSELPALAQDPQ